MASALAQARTRGYRVDGHASACLRRATGKRDVPGGVIKLELIYGGVRVLVDERDQTADLEPAAGAIAAEVEEIAFPRNRILVVSHFGPNAQRGAR